MAFRSRRYMRKMVHRSLQKYKHQVDAVFTNVNGGAAVQTASLILGSDNPTIAGATNVQARARVMSIYIEFAFNTSQPAAGGQWRFNWIIFYNPQTSLTTPPPSAVGIQTQKNYVIKSGQCNITSRADQGQSPFKFMGVVRIPKKYQRFMNGDLLQFAFDSNATGNNDQCTLKCIYKEIRG